MSARSSPVRDTAIVVVAVGLVLLLVWALGGFGAALQFGRRTAAGTPIELQRWRIVVVDAAYTDQARAGYDVEPRIRVTLQATNLTDETLVSPDPGVIGVRVGDRVLSDEQLATADTRSYNYDPDVAAPLVLDLPWSEGAPGQVSVLVRDERRTENFVYDEAWTVGDVAASVTVDCPDQRVAR